MSDYKCKVRIIKDIGITVHAQNRKEAKEEAEKLCKHGWGLRLPLGEHTEVIEIERMTAKKKAQERESNEVGK